MAGPSKENNGPASPSTTVGGDGAAPSPSGKASSILAARSCNGYGYGSTSRAQREGRGGGGGL